MKLNKQNTDTGAIAPSWDYSLQQIDTTEVTQVRFAVYDNCPDINPVYEKNRYRAELQLWTTTAHNKPCDYKLYSYMSNFKTYLNNKWKQKTDDHRDWYVREVERAKSLHEEIGSGATIVHANLKASKRHSGRTDGSFGAYDQPRYAMHLIHTLQEMHVICHIEEYSFKVELDEYKKLDDGAIVRWYRDTVS